MNLNIMLNAMEYAMEHNQHFAVAINIIGCDKPEIIINPPENLKHKIEYYKIAYDEECKLKSYEKIKIMNYAFGNDFNFLKQTLLGDKNEKHNKQTNEK